MLGAIILGTLNIDKVVKTSVLAGSLQSITHAFQGL
jgi:hypothetical protein